MKLTKVTFTGVDERTDVKRLVQLQKRFPFVEFGVLLSYDWQFNGNRFVDPLIISVLRDRELSLSAHFCGQAALDVAAGKKFKIEKLLGNNARIFKRCQLNLKAAGLFSELRRLPPIPFIEEVIIQMHTPELCKQFLAGQRPRFASYLLDASCGAGIDTPIDIVTSPGVHIGYAGGIGPDNVEGKLRTLLEHPTDDKFWIDMETRVRTEDWFDLDKVEQVLEICAYLNKEYSPSK